MKKYDCLLVLLVGSAWCPVAQGQGPIRQFEMVDEFDTVTAVIDQNRERLRIRLRSGERRQYNREPKYDSPDGLYYGYTNFELNRVLRFPTSGRGVCWVADLDDRFPQFRRLPQRARPLRGGITSPTELPWGFGYGASGYGANGYGANDGPTFSTGPYVPMPYSPDPLLLPYRLRPQSVLLESKVVANPPLPPARLRLLNPTKRTLQVAVVDLGSTGGSRSLKLAAGQSADIEVARDNGAKRISRYQTFDARGYPIEKEVVNEIPPALRYEIVVHEWAMQSVAIDRTGKSPNVIEDINMQGRGLGRFPLPPGDALHSGTIDVYRAAVGAGNPGGIAPIVPADRGAPGRPTDNASALEDAVLEAQRRAMSDRRP